MTQVHAMTNHKEEATPVSHNAANSRVILLPVSQLRVDNKYQRDLNEPRVRKMGEFNSIKADTITVSARSDGRFVVLDGQHRLVLARKYNVKSLWALVHEDLTEEDEAELFVTLNTERVQPKSIQIFKARLRFDPIAQDIEATLAEHGWAIDYNRHAHTTKRTGAVAILDKLYQHGPAILGSTLDTISEAWPEEVDHGKADVLRGVGEFIARYRTHPRMQPARLTQKLAEKPLRAFRQEIRDIHGLTSMSGDMAQSGAFATLKAYNRDLRSGRLPALTKNQYLSLVKDRANFIWPDPE